MSGEKKIGIFVFFLWLLDISLMSSATKGDLKVNSDLKNQSLKKNSKKSKSFITKKFRP